MNATKIFAALPALCLLLVFAGPLHAQQVQLEPLLEVPLHPLPATMTYDDYVDSNRRISMGMAYALIPGGVHFYAGEPTKGWIVAGAAVAGLACMIAGGGLAEDGDPQWQKTDHEIHNEAGQRYEKIPDGIVSVAGKPNETTTTYKLKPLEREYKGTKGTLSGIGGLLVVGSYVYGILDGIATIERKRDKARFKYGKIMAAKPQVSFAPSLHRDGAGLAMNVRF